MGEQVLDLVIPYIENTEDRNSVSLVSHRFYETDAITRKRLTVHTLYYPNPPPSLSKRFPSIESLTLKGPPNDFNGYVIRLTPWIQQLALEFRCLKELHLRHLVVHDEDLEKLATTRGKDLRTLTIKMCQEFSTNGLMHVSKYCNQLKTLCLGHSNYIDVKDGVWLHQLALNSTVLEMFKFKNTDVSDAQHLTLLAKNCCNSLISLRIGNCYLSKLGDAFRYAARLELFSGVNCDYESDLVGFQFPPNMRSIIIQEMRALMNTESALTCMAELRVMLEQEKANIKTNIAHMDRVMTPMEGWKDLKAQIKHGEAKTSGIISKLCGIEESLEELPASKRARIETSFSRMRTEADVIMNAIVNSVKIQSGDQAKPV
ncbi:hypothetical protein CTI12_AA507750 [Artemisia annua]|uniref:COI1 F-box domain-containing protein n=1 Tax=Artemisia annua TaxID=35608 RepID=A0A2U1LC35_ARTAN|nr:hypothetical protein CTI12_AA507750 [Artemisia annua]